MRCLQRRPIRTQKEDGNREKAWSMLQGNTKKGKKTKALAARAFDRKSGTPGWIRTSGLPLRSDLGTPVLRDFLYLKIPYFQGFFALRVLSCVTEFLLILPRF